MTETLIVVPYDPDWKAFMPDWLASRLSFTGLVVVVVQQVPAIVWAMYPPKVDPFARNSAHPGEQ
jgi:hypothetical protein